MADINFTGVGSTERLAAALNRAVTETPERVGEAVNTSRRRGERIAKTNAPVLTGHLRSVIDSKMTGETDAVVTSNAAYSLWVDRGTSRARPNPYMGRTATALESILAAEVGKAARPDL